jgi:Tol biopolymer transport system component
MGEVYRARDPRLGREVAIKILPAQFATDPERLRRFEQEARAAAALNDPNLLAIYDLGTQSNGAPYIVSELLEGETLRDRLRTGPLPMRKAIEYSAQIARGLAAAHDKKIVHRDLKPENIFIIKEGRAKILDFGLAKLTERQIGNDNTFAPTDNPTTPGMVIGTIGYMSPEQVRGKEADHRSDIFSFGAILYEMLSGKRAFRGETTADTLSAILKEEPPELTETNRAVPPAIERLVRHCLEKNPEERFQSARDIAFDLESLSNVSSGTLAASAGAAGWSHSRRRAVFAAVGTLGLLAASATAWWAGATHASTDFPEYKSITFRRGAINNARFGSDGKTVIYSAAWEGANYDIYTGRTDSLGEHAMGLDNADLLAVSSAGEMAIRTNTAPMGGFARRGLISVVPTAGGAPRPIIENGQDVDWSPDGKQMCLVRFIPEKDLWRLEYPAGKVLQEGSNWYSNPRISPDGQHIAFFDHGNSTGDDRGAVAVVDLAGNKKTLSTDWASLQGLAWSPDSHEVWFSGATVNIHNLYSVTLKGKLRRLASMPADVAVQDSRPDGKVLLKKQVYHFEIYGGGEGQPTERKLDWLDWSLLRAISPDGKYVLFEEEGEGGGPDYTVYMRATDGSPAIALGKGVGVGFSPDNLWVLTSDNKTPSQFTLVPTGAGEPRQVTHDQIDHLAGRFLPDGKRVIFIGREQGHAARAYLLDLDSGATKPLTPEGVTGRALSPDGTHFMAKSKGTWMKWSLDGGEPMPVPGMQSDDLVFAWVGDGRQLLIGRPDEVRPRKVYLFDIATQKRTLWKAFGPQDMTGASNPGIPVISSDGKHYAYQVVRNLSDLYVVNGLK